MWLASVIARSFLLSLLAAAPALACDRYYVPPIDFSLANYVFQGRVVSITVDTTLRAGTYYPRIDGPTDLRPPAGVLVVEPTAVVHAVTLAARYTVTMSFDGSECEGVFASADLLDSRYEVGDTILVVAQPRSGASVSGAKPLDAGVTGVLSPTGPLAVAGLTATPWTVPNVGPPSERDPRSAIQALRELRTRLDAVRRGPASPEAEELETTLGEAHRGVWARMEYELVADRVALQAAGADEVRIPLLVKIRAYWSWWAGDTREREADCRYSALVAHHLRRNRSGERLRRYLAEIGLRPFPPHNACEAEG